MAHDDDDDASQGDDLNELLRRLLGGGTDGAQLDPELLSRLSGMNIDPATLQQMMTQMQAAFAGGEEATWEMASRQALQIAGQSDLAVSSAQRSDLDQAFSLANLWLGEATTVPELAQPGGAITRARWVELTLPVWRELAEPVSGSIADAMTAALVEQTGEEFGEVAQGAGRLMRTVGGSLFATQLGQVVGRLSMEVVSGGDVGIPLLPAGHAAILPQNFADFGAGLEIPDDQLALATATRELAHARLFRHAKWLRLDVIAQIGEFARGIRIDVSALEDVASRFDPSSPDELRQLLESGALIPPRSDQQNAALSRLEDVLATVEGWVEVVTADATARLPHADRIAEVVRRRRAVGGPAEKALGSLVGLELRPRRAREAASMWRAITDAVGVAARDALWDYPDLMPTSADIDDPSTLIARLQADAAGTAPEPDEFDDALRQLLAEESGDAPRAAGTDDERDDDPTGTADGGRPV